MTDNGSATGTESATEVAGSSGKIEDVLMLEREHWVDGPPHELFKRMRGECPVHWTSEGHRIPRRQPASGR